MIGKTLYVLVYHKLVIIIILLEFTIILLVIGWIINHLWKKPSSNNVYTFNY